MASLFNVFSFKKKQKKRTFFAALLWGRIAAGKRQFIFKTYATF
jgi:hypothetical protein